MLPGNEVIPHCISRHYTLSPARPRFCALFDVNQFELEIQYFASTAGLAVGILSCCHFGKDQAIIMLGVERR